MRVLVRVRTCDPNAAGLLRAAADDFDTRCMRNLSGFFQAPLAWPSLVILSIIFTW